MRRVRLMVWILTGIVCCTVLASCANHHQRESTTDYDQKLRADIKDGNLLEVRYDLEMGASAAGDDTTSPLYLAIDRERPDIIGLLTANGADVNAKTTRGTTPLHYACEHARSTAVVTVLIEAGADVNARDLAQRTPLHWAADSGATDLVDLLIERGADINAKDELLWTPLKLATMKNSTSVRDLLLKHGATE